MFCQSSLGSTRRDAVDRYRGCGGAPYASSYSDPRRAVRATDRTLCVPGVDAAGAVVRARRPDDGDLRPPPGHLRGRARARDTR